MESLRETKAFRRDKQLCTIHQRLSPLWLSPYYVKQQKQTNKTKNRPFIRKETGVGRTIRSVKGFKENGGKDSMQQLANDIADHLIILISGLFEGVTFFLTIPEKWPLLVVTLFYVVWRMSNWKKSEALLCSLKEKPDLTHRSVQ